MSNPTKTDPPLLNDHSEFKSYTVGNYTYNGIRIFYKPRDKIDALPNVPPLPLFVFIHGLGGSAAQFAPLLVSLAPISTCLAIDLPGCGRSAYSEKRWAAYTTEALCQLLETIIEEHRDRVTTQRVVLFGHSMGTSLCAYLASKRYTHKTDLVNNITGLVAICPVSGPPPDPQVRRYKSLLWWTPAWIFNIWRKLDRFGGTESKSVKRFVGEGADVETKRLQLMFNEQVRTAAWMRMARGALPTTRDGESTGGIPNLEVWHKIDIPLYLIGGANDNVTPPSNVRRIMVRPNQSVQPPVLTAKEASGTGSSTVAPPPASGEQDGQGTATASGEQGGHATATASGEESGHGIAAPSGEQADNETATTSGQSAQQAAGEPAQTNEPEPESEPSTPRTLAPPNAAADDDIPEQPLHLRGICQSTVMAAPASHAMLYSPMTVRILAAHICDFLTTSITGRLAYSWQLQYLAKEGKWDMKNLAKWKSVDPVSSTLGPKDAPIFVAMKTLREVDEDHCPAAFVRDWGGRVAHVIDISRDPPSYESLGLNAGGIQYHKMSTVSKVPPTNDEVADFIRLVDNLRDPPAGLIGVHCHYGFNRTGYFIVCYLIERCGFTALEALEAFAEARPPGIRHQHFRDKLFLKYGMRARPSTESA